MKNILEIKNLSFHYDEYNGKTGLSTIGNDGIEDVTFSIPEGSFVTLCGSTGSGKSTLLKLIKRDVITSGKRTGNIYFDGEDIDQLSAEDISSKIGLLFQNPEDQIVTDKVWQEIAFGLENLGMSQADMETRLAEALAFFRLENISRSDTASLSGGQKQLVSLASILAMYPRLLLLDEPTSMLDPEAAEHYIATLKKLQSSLGLTVIIAEHNLDNILPLSDMLMVMDKGQLICCDTTKEALTKLADTESDSLTADFPLPTRYGMHIRAKSIPLDINSGRMLIKERALNPPKLHTTTTTTTAADAVTTADAATTTDVDTAMAAATACPDHSSVDTKTHPAALTIKNMSFRYTGSDRDVINDFSATFNKGCIYALLGCNASGKSTLLNILAGNLKPQLGRLMPKLSSLKIAYMPQDTDNLFVSETIEKDLLSVGLKKDDYPEYIRHLDFSRSPLDLSGGEKQLLGLAKVTALNPQILLLDEPTKGTDNLSRALMTAALRKLRDNGTTIIIACHDMSFAAECADICGIISMGRLIGLKNCREFFISNKLYTTPARNMTLGIIDDLYLEEDIFKL